MKDFGNFPRVVLAVKPVDFRKQIYGLAALVKEQYGENPSDSRSLFLFTNKRRTAVKVLYWDQTGFALWMKTLEKDRFKWPRKTEEAKLLISQREIRWLLQGIDIEKIKVHEPVKFSSIV